MHLPRGFHVDDAKLRSNYTLKLKKNIYSLEQSSYNWSELLKAGLMKLNFTWNKVDPCLYFKDNFICAIYVDDTIFWFSLKLEIVWRLNEMQPKLRLSEEIKVS